MSSDDEFGFEPLSAEALQALDNYERTQLLALASATYVLVFSA